MGHRGNLILAVTTLALAACDDIDEGYAVLPAESCTVPVELDLATEPTPPDRIPDAPATGHVLALSWSPEFCRFRADVDRHAGQCRDNRFGFILHGLWPQAGAGPHPRSCRLAEPVNEAVAREHFCMMPSAWLQQHQWASHGTCGWGSPDAYFAASKRLWDDLVRPDLFALSRREDLTAANIRAAFVVANPDLPPSAVGIQTNNRGWLEEVFVCMDLEFAPRPCAAREYGADDGTEVSVWRGGRTG
ncbi:MAG: ribonuclease T [Pacificimonas sp.]|jgi:ribonuclease T2|nr:ribonuclease T [Pacificimonas sp.]